jgi:predicted HicB family RNase H-like nuclease
VTQLTLRIQDQLHTKLRVLAAFKNVSQNDLVNLAVKELIDRWEEKHGNLPNPPEETD